MTKTLYILRHAKSDWPANIDDRHRPLSASGNDHAHALAQKMQDMNYIADLVLCSSARRTKETAKIVCGDQNINYDDALYLASAGHLYETAKSIDDRYQSALFIGHNPGIHSFVQLLVGTDSSGQSHQIMGNYKTGCLSVLKCSCESWKDLAPGANDLADLIVGKEIG